MISESFDKVYFSKYLGRKLNIVRGNKNISISDLSEKTGILQPHLSTLLSGTRTVSSLDQFEKVSKALGLSNLEFKEMVKNAKKEEYKKTTGDNRKRIT